MVSPKNKREQYYQKDSQSLPCIWTGSLRSWIHYCQLRMGNGTQKEHAEVASKCWDIVAIHFPEVVEAIDGFLPQSPTGVTVKQEDLLW